MATILFPVFARTREIARRTRCAAHLRQLGLGLMQYAQDSDEKMPLFSSNGGNRPTWRALIQPYTKSVSLLACPSNPAVTLGLKELGNAPAGNFTTIYPVSYAAANVQAGGGQLGAFDTSNSVPAALPTFTSPAKCILVVECTAAATRYIVDYGSGSGYGPYLKNPPAQYNCSANASGSCTYEGAFFSGHLGTSNLLFVDGHVKAMKPLATLSVTEGGTGSDNLWTRNGSLLQALDDRKDALANLGFAESVWR